MLNSDKFTVKVQEALMSARTLVLTNNNQQIEPVHILSALLEQIDGIATPIFQKLGVNIPQLLADLTDQMNRIPKVTGTGAIEVVLSKNTSQLFDNAWKEAELLKDQFLSTEHLIIAITKDDSSNINLILRKYGINQDRIMQAL